MYTLVDQNQNTKETYVMNIIRQKNTENELHNIVRQFTSLIGLSKLAKLVNYRRHSEISLMKVIEWLLTTKFLGRSLYRARETPNFTSRTVRNNLNDGRINWQRLVCQVGGHLIKHLRPFIDRRRRLALIIDDTLFSREYATQTELLARVFDHDKQLYIKGYRALTLGWSDANTFLPINFALMSSKKPQNVLGKSAKTTDQRTIAGRRRRQAQQKMNLVSLQLVKQALINGVPADYVLFDSWYSSPKMFYELTKLGLNGVGMLKRSSKVYYQYRGRQYSVKALYKRLQASKYQPKQAYQYSCFVEAHVGNQNSSFAWYSWPIGPGKMTTWYWQRLSYPFSHKRSFNYTPEDGKLRITLKLPSNIYG
ncbi:transposase [Limosilactobacillus fermentum]